MSCGDRDIGPVGLGVALTLAAVGPQRLAEVPVGVQQADADQRHAEVGRRFQVVAGEHPESARVQRDAGVQPELEREVGDQHVAGVIEVGEPGGGAQIPVQPLGDASDLGDIALVGCGGVQPGLGHAAQQGGGVARHLLPQLDIEGRTGRAPRRAPGHHVRGDSRGGYRSAAPDTIDLWIFIGSPRGRVGEPAEP